MSYFPFSRSGTPYQIAAYDLNGNLASQNQNVSSSLSIGTTNLVNLRKSTILVQDQDTIGGALAIGATSTIWQSFTCGVTSNLAAFSLRFSTLASNTYNIFVYLGNGVAGTVLTSQTGTYSGSGDVLFVLNTPVAVTAGTQYTCRIQQINNFPISGLLYSNTNVYSGGESNLSSTWDLKLVTYYQQEGVFFQDATSGDNILQISNNGQLVHNTKTGCFVPASLNSSNISAFPTTNQMLGGIIWDSDLQMLRFYARTSASFTPLNSFNIVCGYPNIGANTTVALRFSGDTNNRCITYCRARAYKIIAATVAVDVARTAGSIVITILRDGVVIGTLSFDGSQDRQSHSLNYGPALLFAYVGANPLTQKLTVNATTSNFSPNGPNVVVNLLCVPD